MDGDYSEERSNFVVGLKTIAESPVGSELGRIDEVIQCGL